MNLHRRAIARSALAFAAAAALPKVAAAAPTTHEVTVDPDSSRFTPADLVIRLGDTVEWENTGFVAHSVTFDPAKSKIPGAVVLPDGVAPFDSGLMKKGEKFRHTFTTKGVHKYVCKFHENMGMVGSVTVK